MNPSLRASIQRCVNTLATVDSQLSSLYQQIDAIEAEALASGSCSVQFQDIVAAVEAASTVTRAFVDRQLQSVLSGLESGSHDLFTRPDADALVSLRTALSARLHRFTALYHKRFGGAPGSALSKTPLDNERQREEESLKAQCVQLTRDIGIIDRKLQTSDDGLCLPISTPSPSPPPPVPVPSVVLAPAPNPFVSPPLNALLYAHEEQGGAPFDAEPSTPQALLSVRDVSTGSRRPEPVSPLVLGSAGMQGSLSRLRRSQSSPNSPPPSLSARKLSGLHRSPSAHSSADEPSTPGSLADHARSSNHNSAASSVRRKIFGGNSFATTLSAASPQPHPAAAGPAVGVADCSGPVRCSSPLPQASADLLFGSNQPSAAQTANASPQAVAPSSARARSPPPPSHPRAASATTPTRKSRPLRLPISPPRGKPVIAAPLRAGARTSPRKSPTKSPSRSPSPRGVRTSPRPPHAVRLAFEDMKLTDGASASGGGYSSPPLNSSNAFGSPSRRDSPSQPAAPVASKSSPPSASTTAAARRNSGSPNPNSPPPRILQRRGSHSSVGPSSPPRPVSVNQRVARSAHAGKPRTTGRRSKRDCGEARTLTNPSLCRTLFTAESAESGGGGGGGAAEAETVADDVSRTNPLSASGLLDELSGDLESGADPLSFDEFDSESDGDCSDALLSPVGPLPHPHRRSHSTGDSAQSDSAPVEDAPSPPRIAGSLSFSFPSLSSYSRPLKLVNSISAHSYLSPSISAPPADGADGKTKQEPANPGNISSRSSLSTSSGGATSSSSTNTSFVSMHSDSSSLGPSAPILSDSNPIVTSISVPQPPAGPSPSSSLRRITPRPGNDPNPLSRLARIQPVSAILPTGVPTGLRMRSPSVQDPSSHAKENVLPPSPLQAPAVPGSSFVVTKPSPVVSAIAAVDVGQLLTPLSLTDSPACAIEGTPRYPLGPIRAASSNQPQNKKT